MFEAKYEPLYLDEKAYKEMYTREEFYKLNMDACDKLKKCICKGSVK